MYLRLLDKRVCQTLAHVGRLDALILREAQFNREV